MATRIRFKRKHLLWFIALTIIAYYLFFITRGYSWISKENANNDRLLVPNEALYDMEKRTGLSANGSLFAINGQPLTIISGAIHYFRLPHEYWRDRLRKMKACGLNTIETYVPWNMHEPIPGKYDFNGDLNLVGFIKLADEMNFFVILRPGPYICAEWEFGGLPSWLLRDPSMRVRTMYPNYIKAVDRYFGKLLPLVEPLQYKRGGPIIAFQLDNEYGSYFKDKNYLPYLKKLLEKHSIDELYFISDSIEGLKTQTIPNVLKTVNFKHVESHLTDLGKMQPHAPLMVMEFWTGWFDWWGELHHTLSVQEFGDTLNEILAAGASVNFYMFFGGTNFGFMNGGFLNGETYNPDVTSYDYDALISENGDLTHKYFRAKSLIGEHYPANMKSNVFYNIHDTMARIAYNSIPVSACIEFWDVLHLVSSEKSQYPKSMEMLDINDGAGQSYGYTLYSAEFEHSSSIKLEDFQNVQDRGILFIDRDKKLTIYQNNKKNPYALDSNGPKKKIKIEILIENSGRTNWAVFDNQRKGLVGPLKVGKEAIQWWTIQPLEMKPSFIENLNSLMTTAKLSELKDQKLKAPTFFIATLHLKQIPKDTYVDMTDWGKGVVFVNGKNLGRYWSLGPQKTLFLPAPWLMLGVNKIVIFEEEKSSTSVKFSDDPKIA